MLFQNFRCCSSTSFLLLVGLLLVITVPVEGKSNIKLQQMFLRLFKIKLSILPRFQPIGCERGTFYASFNPACQQEVASMIYLLQKKSDPMSLLNLAEVLRDLPTTHPYAWYTALMTVVMARPELRNLHKPHPVYFMPDSFFASPSKATVSTKQKYGSNGNCWDERTGRNNGIENRLWYFREDFQVNAHHLLWHVTYPSYLNFRGPNIPHGDRRGELFYYMHHSMMARYQTERLCNGLDLVPPFNLQRGYVMKVGYDPHLDDTNSASRWKPRAPNTVLPDVIYMQATDGRLLPVVLANTIQSRDHLYQGIDNGYFINTAGQQVPLNNFDGVDQLMCTGEASAFTVNLAYYGNVHNEGHILVGRSSDPLEPSEDPQIMMDNKVSMRDPIFYYWHVYIDAILNRHKDRLPKYQINQGNYSLLWESVTVEYFGIRNSRGTFNTLSTFFSYKNLTWNRGLDFNGQVNSPYVNYCVKHLDHEEFTYHLYLNAIPTGFPVAAKATVRIYLAPTYGANGRQLTIEEQRLLFFVLDTFTVTLSPGLNRIIRSSKRNTLTVPWAQPLDIISSGRGVPLCGCGWPQHMLMPKGTKTGMQFTLFAIVSNEELSETTSECKSAYLFCGVPGKLYPESKPMGWPFDRKLQEIVEIDTTLNVAQRPMQYIHELMRYVPNSATTAIVIKHNG